MNTITSHYGRTAGLRLAPSWSLVLVAAVVVGACRGGSAQEARGDDSNGVLPVRAAPVRDTVLVQPIVAVGTVAPKDEIALSFTVGGVIAQVAVDAGDAVHAGQVLAALDLRETDATLAKARSASDKAERDLARAQRLYADSVFTLAQLQDAETVAQLARADLETALFNRRYAVIVAPSAGTILRRSAEPGETVPPRATVLVLGSRARGNVVEVGLADRDVVRIRKGDEAVVRFDAFPGRAFSGRVTQVAAAADPGTGTYLVEITMSDAGTLTAGLVGHVELRSARGTRTKLVPVEAVLEADGDAATVYTLSPDSMRAERRRVRVAFIQGDRVAVTEGLENAIAVLTDGASYVNDGARVELLP